MSTTNKTNAISYRTVIYIALLICFPFNLLGSKSDSTSLSFRLNTNSYFEKDFLTEMGWNSIRTDDEIAPNNIPKTTTKYKYAFHPFWMGTSYRETKYFENIDRIGYFAYILTPFKSRTFPAYSWTNTSLLGEAINHDCKVDLVVYCPTISDLDTLLNNDTLQDNYITEILDLALHNNVAYKSFSYNADGINLFIGALKQRQKKALARFIKTLKAEAFNNDLEVVLSLPLSDSTWYNQEVKDLVDLIIPNDFDYYGNLIIPHKIFEPLNCSGSEKDTIAEVMSYSIFKQDILSWFFEDAFTNQTPTRGISQILFLLSVLCLFLIVLYSYVCVIHNLAYKYRNLFFAFMVLVLIIDFGYFVYALALQLTINLDVCLIVVALIIGLFMIRQLFSNNSKLS